jgi:hypothetical protein
MLANTIINSSQVITNTIVNNSANGGGGGQGGYGFGAGSGDLARILSANVS